MFDVAATFALRVLGAGAAFGLQILLSRMMTTADYGAYALVWTWLLALGSFGAMGFAESAVRFVPRYIARGDHAKAAQFQAVGLSRGTRGSLTLASLIAFAAWVLPVSPDIKSILVCLAIGLPFLSLEYFAEGVARSHGRFRLITIITYVIRPLVLGTVVTGLWLMGAELTFPLVAFALLATVAVTSLLLAALVLAPFSPPASHSHSKLWTRSSLPLLFVSGLEDVMSYADVILVGLFLGATEAALYFAASRILILAGFAHYAVYLVYGRVFSLSHSSKDLPNQQKHARHAIGLTLMSALAVAAGAILFGPVLLALFGEQFTQAYAVLVVLSIGIICKAVAGQSHELLLVKGKQKDLLTINAISLVSCLLLLVWGISTAGALGAAAAMTLAWTIRSALLLVVVTQKAKTAGAQA